MPRANSAKHAHAHAVTVIAQLSELLDDLQPVEQWLLIEGVERWLTPRKLNLQCALNAHHLD